MLIQYLDGNIQFAESVKSWEEGIRLSAYPLLEKKYITDGYIDAIIENVRVNGNYIIILPEVAMPHARKEKGALKTGLSFLSLKTSINFPEQVPVSLFFTLSADTDNGHLDLLSELAELLMDETIVEKLKAATTSEEIINILNGG